MSTKKKIIVSVDEDLLKKAKARVHITDDNELITEGLRELIRTQVRRNFLDIEGAGWGEDEVGGEEAYED